MPSRTASNSARLLEVGLMSLARFSSHCPSSLLIIQPIPDSPGFPRDAPSNLSLYHPGGVYNYVFFIYM